MSKTTTMTALRQLSGDYGVAGPGDTIEVTEEVAESYESRGLAVRGSKKVTDKVFEQANEVRAENERAVIEEEHAKALAEAPENKAVEPSANKSAKK